MKNDKDYIKVLTEVDKLKVSILADESIKVLVNVSDLKMNNIKKRLAVEMIEREQAVLIEEIKSKLGDDYIVEAYNLNQFVVTKK